MEDFANIILEVSKKYDCEDIFIGGTLDGKDLAPSVAAKPAAPAAVATTQAASSNKGAAIYQAALYC